jgi:SpoVK/Ycf46/Vps4 family AAA+-type ATPase
MDLVRGKGKGLIILLHGVPGVGKTSTAESIASFTKRPLYPITCGDLSETAREVEESLEAHFTLAHRWGCILLLDEADGFPSQAGKR